MVFIAQICASSSMNMMIELRSAGIGSASLRVHHLANASKSAL
jgi:hypothetical protein